jgi:SAM-dependent methyltransferase
LKGCFIKLMASGRINNAQNGAASREEQSTMETRTAIKVTRDTYDKASSCFANRDGFNPTRDIIESFLSRIRPSGTILDIGCGEGRDILAFKQRGIKTIGIDISHGMLTIGKEQNKLSGLIQSDMRNIPLISSSIAGVWSWAVFHHLPKQLAPAALSELHRILEPNGVILLTTKMGSGERILYDYGFPRFFAFYEPDELVELCSSSGLKQIHVTMLSTTTQTWIALFAHQT